jgi:hypothetical protein
MALVELQQRDAGLLAVHMGTPALPGRGYGIKFGQSKITNKTVKNISAN